MNNNSLHRFMFRDFVKFQTLTVSLDDSAPTFGVVSAGSVGSTPDLRPDETELCGASGDFSQDPQTSSGVLLRLVCAIHCG